jgi:hypothetical protein
MIPDMYLGQDPIGTPVSGTLVVDVWGNTIDQGTVSPDYGPSPSTYQQYGPTLEQAGKTTTSTFPWWLVLLAAAVLLIKKR